MASFIKYRRRQILEMRPITKEELELAESHFLAERGITISLADAIEGSPRNGDFIARDPKNPENQWLVTKQYFEDNFEHFLNTI